MGTGLDSYEEAVSHALIDIMGRDDEPTYEDYSNQNLVIPSQEEEDK